MKFLTSEHKSIVALFESKKISSNSYSFRKKKGLLYIELENQLTPFCFYRKTVSKLTKEMKFEEVTAYFIGQKKDQVVETWEEVLNEIRCWLDKA